MRAITKKAFEAFQARKTFSLDNTAVFIIGGYLVLQIFQNSIVRQKVGADGEPTGPVEISTADHPTNATKERLRPFCESLCTVKGELFLDGNPWSGDWIAMKDATETAEFTFRNPSVVA